MSQTKKHLTAASRMLVLVSMLTSIGFTNIRHDCTAPTDSCCASNGGSVPQGCHREESVPADQPSFADTCHTNTLVGEATIAPAVVPKDSKLNSFKYEVGAATALPPVILEVPIQPHSRGTSLYEPQWTTPDKYLLFSSLLI